MTTKFFELPLETEHRMKEGERLFMNGYQSWTYSPEWTGMEKLTPFGKKLPKFLVDMFHLDRYGDYHFIRYADKPGMYHGFSFCYFRIGEQYELYASLGEDRGYTVFRYSSMDGKLTAERDLEGLSQEEKEKRIIGDRIFYAEGTMEEVFDAWFKELGVRPRTTEKLAGYSSWYNRYQNISESNVIGDLEGCTRALRKGDLFQIDDGWETAVGDWLECDSVKFPHGMKYMTDAIHNKGFKAGLWLAPFAAQANSSLVTNHPDWLFKHNESPWVDGCNWGGYYGLDIDNTEVLEYLESTFMKVFSEWGFDLVKLDFLYAVAPFGTEDETRAERMGRGMKLLRKLCGDHLILGCGVPLMPSFGIVDYMRIGCDVGLDWDNTFYMRWINRERVSTKQSLENTVNRFPLNGRAFLNDPDVFFLRDNNIRLTNDEKKILYTTNASHSGILLCSDNMSDYTEDKIETYRKVRELFGA